MNDMTAANLRSAYGGRVWRICGIGHGVLRLRKMASQMLHDCSRLLPSLRRSMLIIILES